MRIRSQQQITQIIVCITWAVLATSCSRNRDRVAPLIQEERGWVHSDISGINLGCGNSNDTYESVFLGYMANMDFDANVAADIFHLMKRRMNALPLTWRFRTTHKYTGRTFKYKCLTALPKGANRADTPLIWLESPPYMLENRAVEKMAVVFYDGSTRAMHGPEWGAKGNQAKPMLTRAEFIKLMRELQEKNGGVPLEIADCVEFPEECLSDLQLVIPASWTNDGFSR